MVGFVQDVMYRIRQNIPEAPVEALFRIEASICHDYGGTEPYIGKRVGLEARKAMVAHGLRHKKPLGEVFAQAGVRRSAGYALLKSK